MNNYVAKIDGAYNNLIGTHDELLNRYINVHIENAFSSPDDFSLDVKSYMVLLHAAIEDYIEGISVFTCDIACELFSVHRNITLPFVFMCASSKELKERFKKVENEMTESPCDFLLSSIGKIKSATVDSAVKNNGINVKYLNALLQHCGINFDVSDNEFFSWKTLADYRGDYAHAVVFNHGKPTARNTLSPEDAKKLGNDSISFSLKIRNEALSVLGLPIP